jgi:hypothetical protein
MLRTSEVNADSNIETKPESNSDEGKKDSEVDLINAINDGANQERNSYLFIYA